MPRLLLEVIVQTVADARAAAAGGADRLEVVRAIHDGGLTPALSLVREIAAATPLPLRIMVRENAGYTLEPGELPALRRAAVDFTAGGADGLVIGFARARGLALDDLALVLEAAPAARVTFHRAFDALDDPAAAIDSLGRIQQVDRILTSGGHGTPEQRCERLHAFIARARPRIEIIAGGGVDEDALTLFARAGGVREVHVGRAARDGGDPNGAVSVRSVERLRRLANG